MHFAADDGRGEDADANLVDGDGATDDDAGIGLTDGAAVEGGDADRASLDFDVFGGDSADGAALDGEGRLGWGCNAIVEVAWQGVGGHGRHGRSRGVKAQCWRYAD